MTDLVGQLFAEDLADAPPESLARLRREEERLGDLDLARRAAADQLEAARNSLVDARISSASDAKPTRAFDEADERHRKAVRDADVQTQVVETIRERLVAEVRDGRAAAAQASLDATRRAYDVAAEGALRFFEYIEAMTRAASDERSAAAELANALREGANAGYAVATGGRHVTTPQALEFGVVVRAENRQDQFDTADQLRERLRRRDPL